MQYLELIERRYTGQMTSVEIADFEKLLKTNSALASEWADFNAIANAMSAQASNNLRQEVAASRKELEQEGFFDEIEAQIEVELAAEAAAAKAVATPVPAIKVVKNNLWRRWAVAAGLAGLVVAGWFLRQSSREERLAELERQELIRFGMSDDVRGISANDTFGLIENHIKNGSLSEAEQLLRQFKGEKDERYYYIKGYFHYQKHEYIVAENALNKVIQEALFPSTRWEAQLLKARCLIRQNKREEAQAELNKLIQTQPEEAWKDDFNKIRAAAENFTQNNN